VPRVGVFEIVLDSIEVSPASRRDNQLAGVRHRPGNALERDAGCLGDRFGRPRALVLGDRGEHLTEDIVAARIPREPCPLFGAARLAVVNEGVDRRTELGRERYLDAPERLCLLRILLLLAKQAGFRELVGNASDTLAVSLDRSNASRINPAVSPTFASQYKCVMSLSSAYPSISALDAEKPTAEPHTRAPTSHAAPEDAPTAPSTFC
jgi:hypothetical protein